MENKDCNKNCNNPVYVLKPTQRKMLVFCLRNENLGSPKTLLKEIKNGLNITYRIVNYNVGRLQRLGYLEVLRDGNILFISLTDKAKEYVKTICSNLQSNAQYVPYFLDRAHKVTLKFPLIQKPVDLTGFTVVEGSKLNWGSDLLSKRIDRCVSMQITSKHAILCFTDIYGVDPHSIVLSCINNSLSALRTAGVKAEFPKVVVISQHHALSSKDLAQFTRHYNIHYKSDRLVFDRSISAGEFELVHPVHAQGDFLRLTDVFEAIIRGEVTLDDLKQMKLLIPQIKEVLENLQKDCQNNRGDEEIDA